ncbi:MAG: hypothetical protein ABI241_00600 [Bacteroidia bacterium]
METTKQPLLAFHGQQEIKDKYLARLQAHYNADEIIKGKYWEDGKGCAVGCTVHSSRHKDYEHELGIPMALARLEDRIFEGLPNADAKEFPIQFLTAINVGSELSLVWRKLMIYILIDETYGVIHLVKDLKIKKNIQNVADLFVESLTQNISKERWLVAKKAAAADAAYSAADAAYSAAYAAGGAADDAAYADAYADGARYTYYKNISKKLIEILKQTK